jgi:hypothetical protein
MRGRNLIKLLKTIDLLSRPQGATFEEMEKKLEKVLSSFVGN